MDRLLAHITVVFLFCTTTALASPLNVRAVVDSLETSQREYDDLQIADSLASVLDSAFSDTTSVAKVRDRGFDATRYSMMKRFRPKNQPFISERFLDNTFFSVHARSFKLGRQDYSFGSLGG